jgi:hypothetical protein
MNQTESDTASDSILHSKATKQKMSFIDLDGNN